VLKSLGQLLLDELLGDESGGTVPDGGRVVEDVVDLETTFGLWEGKVSRRTKEGEKTGQRSKDERGGEARDEE